MYDMDLFPCNRPERAQYYSQGQRPWKMNREKTALKGRHIFQVFNSQHNVHPTQLNTRSKTCDIPLGRFFLLRPFGAKISTTSVPGALPLALLLNPFGVCFFVLFVPFRVFVVQKSRPKGNKVKVSRFTESASKQPGSLRS